MLATMRSNKGFSLIEIMVMIVIIGIVTAIGIPSFTSYVRSNRLAASVDRMAADLKMTRSMAIAQSRVYQLAAEEDGYTITEQISGTVIRNREFAGGINLAVGDTVRFFPWGMAEAASLNMQSGHGTRTIDILPTGIVEVH